MTVPRAQSDWLMWRDSSRRNGSSDGESTPPRCAAAAPTAALFLEDSIPARSTMTSLPRRTDRAQASPPLLPAPPISLALA